MIRFLLLLLLLPGAELFANETHEVETFTTTTLGSQFNMAVTTQSTLLRKPSGTHVSTKKTPVHSQAPKKGKILHPLPVNTSVMTEEAQRVQGGGKTNTTNLKPKNHTHNKYISATQNVTHWHPTKMPVTAKSHSQRESSIKKPIVKKAPTPPSKIKSTTTTGKNPSARYQSPSRVHHKNVTMKPGMGHFHHSNASAGVADLTKSHRAATPFRNSLKLGQKNVSPMVERVKQVPLGSQLNKHLKDKANSTSVLLSTVINNSSKSVAHNIHHLTHTTFPNSSFMHGKKTMLYELNSLNTSEHVWRTENMSLVPQIDGQKDLTTLGLLLNLPGSRQSGVMQELNSKVNIRVPDRNIIYNHTKQNSGDTAELSGLGQNGTIRLGPDKLNHVSSTEPAEMGTMANETQSRPNSHSGVDAAMKVSTTKSEGRAHNNVEQQYQTRPELTTDVHIHHNQTHGHKHHKHSDNTVSHHTVTSPGRITGANRHHFKHPHNFTHPHEHNEHWVQHGRQGHPSQTPPQGEKTSFHERPTTINGSDLDASTLSHPRKDLSEPETTTLGPLDPFATTEPKLTTQSLQNPATVSQLTLQTQWVLSTTQTHRVLTTKQAQRVLTTLYEPVITDNKIDPHKPNRSEEESLPHPYPKITIKPVTQTYLPTQTTTYNTTEEFPMELTTQTQPKITSHLSTHKKTEGTVDGSKTGIPFTEIVLTTQSEPKLVEGTQWVEPTQSQPDLTTHSSPYLSTRTFPDRPTETHSRKVRIDSSTEPSPYLVRNNPSSLIPESTSHLFEVSEPPLTTHSPSDPATSELFANSQYNESRTITHGHTESITFDHNKTRSTTQTEPIIKGTLESFTSFISTEPIRKTQTETTTKDETQPVTQAVPATSSQGYSMTQTEPIKKTTTGWHENTEKGSPFQTEPNTSNSISPIHTEMTTQSYTEQPTQTQHITEGTTEPTSKTSGTLVKNETDSITPKTDPLIPTITMGYGRDETESTERTEPTSKVPLHPITPYDHRNQLQSTETQADLGTQTYPSHTTRTRSKLTPTREPDMQTAKEHLTSLPEIPGVSDGHVHTTAVPWTEVSSSSLTGGHHSQDGRWDSRSTLSSNVQTFYPTTRHTSERDHASGLTTMKNSATGTKVVTSPQSNTFTTQTLGEMMSVQPGRDRIFIVDEQQPVFKVQTINITYKMNMTHRAACEQLDSCKAILLQELTSAYKSTPGFDKIEILNVTVAGTALEYKVLFSVRPGSLMSAVQELVLSNPSILFGSSEKPSAYRIYNTTLTDSHADPCTDWFACPRSFHCVPVRKLSALCFSPCHGIFCHNNGICIHRKGQDPECQCPVGRDFWYMGQTCDYRMTHHRLAAIACAVVFCIIICAAATVFILVRRFQTQILQQKVAQTQSSYRRFSRFDDVPTHFWCPSQTWLTASASLNSLDNPAFSSSEEVFPLQALGSCVCGCQDGARNGSQTNQPPQPARAPPRLETSCSSVNDLMIDSGKASDVSVCSWPMEPIHWTPFPILHQLSLQSPFHARRPHSYFEGMELVNTERSWTA